MDSEVVEQKLESLRRCLRRIETKCLAEASILAADIDLQDIISLNLGRAVQISVDIGANLKEQCVGKITLEPDEKVNQ